MKIIKLTKRVSAVLAWLLGLILSWAKLIRPALIALVKRPGKRLEEDSPGPQLERLPALALAPNWPAGRNRRMPHYLIRGRGKLLDAVGQRLLDQVHAERDALNVSAGRVAEASSTEGSAQALRFVHQFGPGQLVATDAMLRAEGPDLYLKLECKPRTVLRYLQYAFYGITFCFLMAAAIYFYFITFGAWRGWVVDYAQKYAASEHLNEQNKASFFEKKLIEGYYETSWGKFREKYRQDRELLNLVAQNTARFQYALENFQSEITVEGDRSAIPQAYNALQVKPLTIGQLILATRFFRSDEDRVQYSMLVDVASSSMLASRSQEVLGPPSLVGAVKTIESLPSHWIFGQNDDSYFASIVPGSVIPLGEIQAQVLHTTHVQRPDIFTLPLSVLITNRQSPDERSAQKRLFQYFDESTTYHPPISAIGLFRKDPRMGMVNLGLPLGIMSGILGFFVWRMPKSWLRFPCRWLGWMTPDDFETSMEGKNGWLERCLLSTVLHEHFEVDRSDIIDLRN